MSAEVGLENGIEFNVALVVAEQVQLDLIGIGAAQIEVVERIAVRGHTSRVGHTMSVLPTRGLGGEEGSQCIPIGLRRGLPIGADGAPPGAQPLLIGVSVLRDDCGNAVG
jgi:hypothetical protein